MDTINFSYGGGKPNSLKQCPQPCFTYYHGERCPHGCAPPARLLSEHLADLRKSGLSDETILAAGLYTVTDPRQIDRILGWDAAKKGGIGTSLAIPFRKGDGGKTGYTRLKPSKPRVRDGKPVKYESPLGRGNRAYIPPGIADALSDPSRPLIITEGEKKALKATQEGFACVGLVGVYGFQKARTDKTKPRELIEDLAAIKWKGRTVYIAYDSDIVSKDGVEWAEWHLAETLAREGAIVRTIRLPSGTNGEKVGLDDFLCANIAKELRALLDSAVVARRPRKDEPPPPSVWVEELAELRRQQTRLPRRSADLRQPHQFCRRLQSGLFRPITGDTEHLVLTHSCGKPSRCAACASFDRDKRFGDYLYAVDFEPSGKQLYYYTTNSEREWRNFRASQRRAAKGSEELVRRFEAREDAPDNGTIYRVVTPIAHKGAKRITRGEAQEMIRKLCDSTHTRGERHTTVRCWGSWRQKPPERKFERLCRSVDDSPGIEDYLRSIGVDFEIKLSPRGTLYRTLTLHYSSEEQRDAVRQFFVDRDRQRRMSRSEVYPPERNTREGWRRYLAQFDDAFEDFGRRRTG